ncbi:MAG: LysM peptidoglycan-binding domain-containing protein [Chloroflexi bacterium]|nr:LysM peptidoglycan-binding domain-containing protein [Chloroflexota bacterium]
MKYRWVLIFILMLAAIPARAQGEAGDLLARINSLRGSLGLPGYTLNGALSAAAQSQAQWMAETGSISHTRPDGSTPRSRATAYGYATTEVSENIYGGTNAGVDDAWNFWINSRIHYAGLTNLRYKEVGVGIARSDWGAAFVLVFGNPGGPAYVPPQANTGGGESGSQPSFVAGLDSHGNIMHEVQPGDTLGDIALIYGYTWSDIPAMLALNGLSETDIRELEIGSIFLVPPQAGTYTPTAPAETAAPTVALTEPAATATLAPSGTPPPTVAPTETLPPSPTVLMIATADSLPQVFVLVAPTDAPTPTTGPQAQPVAAVVTSAALVKTPGVVTASPRQSPWLAVGLVVQVGVLLVAGFEFIRRARRR